MLISGGGCLLRVGCSQETSLRPGWRRGGSTPEQVHHLRGSARLGQWKNSTDLRFEAFIMLTCSVQQSASLSLKKSKIVYRRVSAKGFLLLLVIATIKKLYKLKLTWFLHWEERKCGNLCQKMIQHTSQQRQYIDFLLLNWFFLIWLDELMLMLMLMKTIWHLTQQMINRTGRSVCVCVWGSSVCAKLG